MMSDEDVRLAWRKKFEGLRRNELPVYRVIQAFRGGDEVLRGGDEVLRGGDEVLRGGDEVLRGALQAQGSQNQAAADIFRRVTEMGGHLVVAFVTPVGAGPCRVTAAGGLRSAVVAEAQKELTAREKLGTTVAAAAHTPSQVAALTAAIKASLSSAED
jgi:hypothetical protein